MVSHGGHLHRRLGIVLLMLAGVFVLLAFMAAFTIYGELAALLAVGCASVGTIVLARGEKSTPGGFVLNLPPGWPPPPAGWSPPPGWQPDPSWPAPPPGWQLWLPGEAKRDHR